MLPPSSRRAAPRAALAWHHPPTLAALPPLSRSWDRQVFTTYKGAGTTGYGADWNYLTSNFLLSNYVNEEQ